VNEANAMGTPVIGYDVPGLRDALAFDNGELCSPHPKAMAQALITMHNLWQNERDGYIQRCAKCLESAKQWSFDRSYNELLKVL
jgi:glycosyltransferase involved in cell wall biosynthesis